MSDLSSLPRVTFADAVTRPHLDFVLPGLLAGSVGMVVGQGSIGKSMLALHVGLAVATGQPVAGGLWPTPAKGPVTLLFGEDAPEILQERMHWLRQAQALHPSATEDADGLLDVRSAAGHDMRVLCRAGGGFADGPFLPVLREIAGGQRLVIIDPLAFLTDADENDNGAATRLIQTLASVARNSGAAIIVLHHVGKAGGEGREAWAAARGASALTTAVRWQVNLMPPTQDEMGMLGGGESERRLWVKTAVVKCNYGDAGDPGWLRRGTGGTLSFLDPMAKMKTEAAAREYEREARGGNGKRIPKVAEMLGLEVIDDPSIL